MTLPVLSRWSVPATLLVCACSGGALASNGADHSSFDLAATRRIIEQQNDRFTQAHVTGDTAAIDAMFASDATAMPPETDAVVGIEALHAVTAEYIKSGVSEFREATTDFYGDEHLVVDQGTYVMTYGPNHTTEHGKYLNVWVNEGGSWKIRANIWNTNAPPAAAK